MEKEMNEKKKTKNITKKAKKIRSIVMMSLLCVLMLSAATYAWFTLSNTAKITNLTMTVGKTSGLQISDTGEDGSFSGSVSFPEIKGILKPATTADGKNFKSPSYDEDGNVKSLATTTDALTKDSEEDAEGYYIEYDFWLLSGKDSTVRLDVGKGTADGVAVEGGNYTGTYILSNEVDSSKKVPGSAAVRISFLDGNKNVLAVYEPNGDIENPKDADNKDVLQVGYDYADENITDNTNVTAVTSTIVRTAAGAVYQDKNANVINLTGGTKAKITMCIWIEGKDAQCVNQIAAKDIIGQLMFTNATETIGE